MITYYYILYSYLYISLLYSIVLYMRQKFEFLRRSYSRVRHNIIIIRTRNLMNLDLFLDFELMTRWLLE